MRSDDGLLEVSGVNRNISDALYGEIGYILPGLWHLLQTYSHALFFEVTAFFVLSPCIFDPSCKVWSGSSWAILSLVAACFSNHISSPIFLLRLSQLWLLWLCALEPKNSTSESSPDETSMMRCSSIAFMFTLVPLVSVERSVSLLKYFKSVI